MWLRVVRPEPRRKHWYAREQRKRREGVRTESETYHRVGRRPGAAGPRTAPLTFTSAQELKSVGTFSAASQTNVTTLTFSDFGAPVHIVAPDFTGPQPRAFSVGGKPSTTCVH